MLPFINMYDYHTTPHLFTYELQGLVNGEKKMSARFLKVMEVKLKIQRNFFDIIPQDQSAQGSVQPGLEHFQG